MYPSLVMLVCMVNVSHAAFTSCEAAAVSAGCDLAPGTHLKMYCKTHLRGARTLALLHCACACAVQAACHGPIHPIQTAALADAQLCMIAHAVVLQDAGLEQQLSTRPP